MGLTARVHTREFAFGRRAAVRVMYVALIGKEFPLQKLRLTIPTALALVVVAAACSSSLAQETNADQAQALLNQGIAQYQAFDFKAAKASLLKAAAKRDVLPKNSQKNLDDLLGKVDKAILEQGAALEAFNAANAALKNNDFAKAREGFTTAAASEYLPAATRREATE